MLDLFWEFIMPLFFETDKKGKLVNKMTLYVTKEVHTYIENEEGEMIKEISKIETPGIIIYEGKVTVDPNALREIMNDPINYPQDNPEVLEQVIQMEQKDMISTVYDMVNSTLGGFNSSAQILINSVQMFFGNPFINSLSLE